jgi:PAS domain S-box-containing protein
METPTPWSDAGPGSGPLFQSNPCPMWVYDLETLAFLAVNEAAVDRYGFSRDEFASMAIQQIRPPEDVRFLEENLSAEVEGPERTGPWRHRTKSGEVIWVEIASRSITFEGRKARLVVVFDITSSVAAARALEQSEIRADSIVAGAIDCIVSMDAAGTIIGFNPAAESTFRTTRDEVIGRKLADVIIPPSLRAKHEEGLARFIATGEENILGHRLELPARRLDGTEFPAELSITLDTTTGEPHFTGFIRDISERKEAERFREQLMAAEQALRTEVEELNASLEQRVADRTRELKSANAELESFSYSVSHDLRAPLRAIDGFAKILAEDFPAQLGPEGERHVTTIRRSARHMGELVDDLLTFSRLSRAPLNTRRIATSDLARQALEDLEDGGHARVVIEELPEASADPALVRIVFTNLLSNALKYSSKREQPEVRVGFLNSEEGPCFFVADNGVGFDMKYAHKLFGVFQRLHLQEDYEGTGVGLATVQRIIHRHGGKVWAEAELDGGAKFYFTLEEQGEPDE